ncbi:hypothetical protein K4L44_14610 [Halosquirtibacter laminarini]|uniref:Uncharacterized protein n=1 Tax=Halosquirtibacter laminarini TaxID=3374600 RepID=A0AC61NDX8_9BACT|nr:hypothetical protein K4L44_14610 [Prolixibacteraceae bacterium]
MKKKFLVSLVAIILLAVPAFAAMTVYVDCGDGTGMYTLIEGSTEKEHKANIEEAKEAICGSSEEIQAAPVAAQKA